jgi:transcriptional regulator
LAIGSWEFEGWEFWEFWKFDCPVDNQKEMGVASFGIQQEGGRVAGPKRDIMQGTLDLMVLRTLEAMGPLHGYAIASRLAQVSDGAIQLNMGSLYPALVRLERRGFVRGRWSTTENNRRARFYSITAPGKRRLDAERAGWTRMAGIIERLLADNG